MNEIKSAFRFYLRATSPMLNEYSTEICFFINTYSGILEFSMRSTATSELARVLASLNSTLVERGIRKLNKNLCRADY